MRPTLIKPGLSRKGTWARRPLLCFSDVFLGGLIAIIGSNALMNAGIAHGLNAFESRLVMDLLWWGLYCAFLLVQFTAAAVARRKPSTQSRTILVSFAAWSGALALFMGLPLVIQAQRSPWRIPAGASPGPRCASCSTPILLGTWKGNFSDGAALLTVTDQDGSRFDGILIERAPSYTYLVQVEGVTYHSGAVKIREKSVLDEAYIHSWALGVDDGQIGTRGLSMCGRGSDTRGHHYLWNFQHVSWTPYVPTN